MSKPLVGSRKVAADALRLANGYALRSTLDSDWRFFSEGSIRTTALHEPTNTVYKVDGYIEENYDNASELRNARRLRRKTFEHVYIPRTSGFNVDGSLILAMEFMGDNLAKHVSRTAYPEARKELFNKCRFEDMHGANFVFAEIDGKVKAAPIDMGSRIIYKNDPYDIPDSRCLSCGDGSVWGN